MGHHAEWPDWFFFIPKFGDLVFCNPNGFGLVLVFLITLFSKFGFFLIFYFVKIWCFWLFFMPKNRDVVFKMKILANGFLESEKI